MIDLQAAKAQVAAMPHDIRVVTRHRNGESETYVERPSVEAYRAMRKMLPACIAEVERLRALLATAVGIIDDCTDDPSKNQHTNEIEYLRKEGGL